MVGALPIQRTKKNWIGFHTDGSNNLVVQNWNLRAPEEEWKPADAACGPIVVLCLLNHLLSVDFGQDVSPRMQPREIRYAAKEPRFGMIVVFSYSIFFPDVLGVNSRAWGSSCLDVLCVRPDAFRPDIKKSKLSKTRKKVSRD